MWRCSEGEESVLASSSKKTTIHLSFARRLYELGVFSAMIFLGVHRIYFAESFADSSYTTKTAPVFVSISIGLFISIYCAYLLYRSVKKFYLKVPRIELDEREISIIFDDEHSKTYSWYDIEIFKLEKDSSFFRFNRDCVRMILKNDQSDQKSEIFPIGLDKNASNLVDFLNIHRLKFSSE